MCKRKGAGEKSSLSLNRMENTSQKPSAELARNRFHAYPKIKTKGDKIAMADLYQSEFILWAWHVVPYHPKLGSIGKEKGN